MNKHFLKIGFLAAILLSTACTSDSENDDTTNLAQLQADVEELTQTARSGEWTITNFVDDGADETTDFAGYDFTFNPDGSLVADNGTSTVVGTWSITIDDHSSDDSDDDGMNDDDDDEIEFNIFFASPQSFNELSEDWDIISFSSDMIQLIDDDDDGDGTTDLLTFEK
ncbi:hypothetical protein [Robiginitalea aurantiaca]|uniref:Lipocalin-like domain-containing protein n=1 Tax=Robiginitalea aurantiaca TaxID=3056915 RepID=A0ABT7WIN9_9FLAO|nr:hypothetical protein [Robiginitalea aurantiaca]MDM9632694.1 hypothetical protein [Robiginitalea aurantiaca]